MHKEKNHCFKAGRNSRVLRIAAVVLAVCLFAAGCQSKSIPPENIAPPRPSVSALVPPAASSATAPSDSAAQSTPGSTDEGNRLSPPLPGGSYVPVGDASQLAGSWLHMVGSEVQGTDGYVYQYRFEEPAGEMMMSFGPYESGAGIFFRGAYQIGAGGISATLYLSSMDGSGTTPVYVNFSAETSGEAPGLLIITLQTYDTESQEFIAAFGPLEGKPIAYIS